MEQIRKTDVVVVTKGHYKGKKGIVRTNPIHKDDDVLVGWYDSWLFFKHYRYCCEFIPVKYLRKTSG